MAFGRCVIVSVAAASVLAAAAPCEATFHIANIDEIMTSYGGDPEVQFVEIVMLASGQNFVAGTKLSAFGADGSFQGVVLTVSNNVLGGSGRRWLMATQAFVTTSGLAADFVFSPGLPTGSGMVCWGSPGAGANEANPALYVDCVSYGAFTGAGNVHSSAPSVFSPDGHSLRRLFDTNDSSTDFECGDPADPANNAFATVDLDATTPCVAATTTTTTVPQTTSTTTVPVPLCGDANGDGEITATDALATLRAAVGSSSCPLAICDADGSGMVTATDALLLLKRAVGQPVELTCP